MSLPRNILIKKSLINRRRNESTKKIVEKIKNLESICSKHKVGDLTFRTCKFGSFDGASTFVDHQEIKGNMRSGILLVKSNQVYTSPDIYDLVKIKRDKAERDKKRK